MREAALNALKIDKSDAEAHVYLAETKRILDWDFDGAEEEFLRRSRSTQTPLRRIILSLHFMRRAAIETKPSFICGGLRRSIRLRCG